MINHGKKFYDFSSPLFPNNEIFFVTGNINNGILHINVPVIYKEQISKLFTDITAANLYDEKIIKKIVTGVSSFLEIDPQEIEFKSSIDYMYTSETINVHKNIDCIYNKKYNFQDNLLAINTKSSIFNIFKNFPHCTAVIRNNEIVSFACTENGALSVETHPDFTGQGFATMCVSHLVYELLTGNYYSEIYFPTTISNSAARKVAEKVGFVEQEKGFWLVINTDISKLNSDFLENGVERVIDYS
jgi:GNAT superfamily N-acetyltransferase